MINMYSAQAQSSYGFIGIPPLIPPAGIPPAGIPPAVIPQPATPPGSNPFSNSTPIIPQPNYGLAPGYGF